jgi:hypothetical protein
VGQQHVSLRPYALQTSWSTRREPPSFLSSGSLITPALPQPGAHVPQPFHSSLPSPIVYFRDTLCSCEVYGVRAKCRKSP